MDATNKGLFSNKTNKNLQQPSSIEIIEKNYIAMKTKLQIINLLEPNDKLGCDVSNNYYIDKYEWGQFLSRKWFQQSREKTSTDLERDFNTLMKIFDNYLEYINSKNKNTTISDSGKLK